ncbi:MAG: hypothetical protein SFU56_01410 [Capsulimonadales bacterium]|nr:hypothetical protein [Capsulimonadales bacterium]
MHYPLDLTFRIFAISSQVNITDGLGRSVAYVKQKAFSLREDITIFADETSTRQLYRIKANKIFDFSARYEFTDPEGRSIGAVRRHGVRSLWRAHYDVFDGTGSETPVFTITEANPWIKVADALLSEVPVVSLFHNYLLNPAYLLKRGDENGPIVLRLKKMPSMVGRRFVIEREGEIRDDEQDRALLGLFMLVLLERSRG